MTRSPVDRTALLRTLLGPQCAASLDLAGWSNLIATARDANLLGALAASLKGAGVAPPDAAQRHLEGVLQLGERQHLSIRWEAFQLQAALGELGIPVVLLKGSAYVMAYPEVAQGRIFGDIDILVPRLSLGDVESQLMLSGWASAKADPYDQRYYREWMHELPPMTHVRRGTVLDIHHTILPLTARNAPDPAAIIARSQPLQGLPALRTPSAEDLVIHSLTHLVHEGELNNGLRDLHDAHVMLAHFGAQPGFWQRLGEIAVGSDLAGPVALGLRLAARLFGTSVPDDLRPALEGPHSNATQWLRWQHAYEFALLEPFSGAASWRAQSARHLIYLRAHALRMPLHLLARHLAVKAWKRANATEPAQ